jgi:IS30 family transposase
VLDLLASGMSPLHAGPAVGVSKTYAYNLHQKMGGVYRPSGTDYCPRYLSREERYEIARLRDAGQSVRAIGVLMGRSASTISRELKRNAAPRTGAYQPEQAHTMAWDRQRRPKRPKLSQRPVLRQTVQRLLKRRWSPEQISGRLKMLNPRDPAMHVSHETIYQSIYVYPRGELKKELQASLRSGRSTRRPRGRGTRGPRIAGAVPIGERPAEVEGRLVPGHHEGDLIKGSMASNSAAGTLVERTTGYLTLLPLPDGWTAEKTADAIITAMSALPAWFARTLTWDNGTELARHQRITTETGIQVYFADPYKPWQRGSNENTNGLIREYLPKGTDLNQHTPAQLQAIADELNDRPRKRLGYLTPREAYDKLLVIEQARVATTA